MLASSANQEGQANHARKLYGIPYESEFNAAGITGKTRGREQEIAALTSRSPVPGKDDVVIVRIGSSFF
jgi:hypothetical protein